MRDLTTICTPTTPTAPLGRKDALAWNGSERWKRRTRKMFSHLSSRHLSGWLLPRFSKFIGLDQICTTGLATNVNHASTWRHLPPLPRLVASAAWLKSETAERIFRHRPRYATASRNNPAQEGEQVRQPFLNRCQLSRLKEVPRACV